MKKILFLGLFLLTSLIQAQELISTYNLENTDFKKAFRFDNPQTKKTVIILKDKTKINCILFDELFKEENKISIPSEGVLDGNCLGYSSKDLSYYAYCEKNDKEIEVKEIDFNTKTVKSQSIPFEFEKKEKKIISFNHQNNFYIISAIRNSNILNLYVFSQNTVSKKSMDCSSIRFINSENRPINLWDFLSEKNGVVYRDEFKVFKNTAIDKNVVYGTYKKKVYLNDENIILGLDNNNNFSQFLFISLKDFTISQKVIQKEMVSNLAEYDVPDSNSFLINDKVFLVKYDAEMIVVTVKDLENNTLKKVTYSGLKTNEYQNSEVYEQEGSFSKRKILEKPAQFTRKVKNLNPSILGYFDKDQYIITIGGVSYPQQQGSAMLGMFGAIGSLAGSLLESNGGILPSYADKRIVTLKSIFKSNFGFSQDKLENSSLEKLQLYLETTESKEGYLSPFELDNHLMLVGINKKENTFHFYKF